MTRNKTSVLIGNAFSLTLIRERHVSLSPISIDTLKEILAASTVVSFWGHDNTRARAEEIVGVSLAPDHARPAITLSPENLPMLNGVVFTTCYVLSPDYIPNYRPSPGVEVASEDIVGWHALKLTWS